MTVSILHDIAALFDNLYDEDQDSYDDLPDQSESITYYDVATDQYVTVSL